MGTIAANVERRRPALVIMFTMQQLALITVAFLALAGGATYWMTTMARYQAVAVARLDGINKQGAIMRETIEAHVRIVESDNAAFLFYARAVCEQMATLTKQPMTVCRTDVPVRPERTKLP